MKVEIICPTGIGHGTQVFVDGQPLTGVSHLKLEIPADGVAELTLKHFLLDNDGQFKLRSLPDGERILAEEVLKFTGYFDAVTAEAVD